MLPKCCLCFINSITLRQSWTRALGALMDIIRLWLNSLNRVLSKQDIRVWSPLAWAQSDNSRKIDEMFVSEGKNECSYDESSYDEKNAIKTKFASIVVKLGRWHHVAKNEYVMWNLLLAWPRVGIELVMKIGFSVDNDKNTDHLWLSGKHFSTSPAVYSIWWPKKCVE